MRRGRRRQQLATCGSRRWIIFDAHALLSSVRAWTGYQALRAGKARAAGREDAHEARLVDVIARDTRTELDVALSETRNLVDSLTRELRIIAELPGRDALSQSLPGKRRDSKAARQTSGTASRHFESGSQAVGRRFESYSGRRLWIYSDFIFIYGEPRGEPNG